MREDRERLGAPSDTSGKVMVKLLIFRVSRVWGSPSALPGVCSCGEAGGEAGVYRSMPSMLELG